MFTLYAFGRSLQLGPTHDVLNSLGRLAKAAGDDDRYKPLWNLIDAEGEDLSKADATAVVNAAKALLDDKGPSLDGYDRVTLTLLTKLVPGWGRKGGKGNKGQRQTKGTL
jgi:hypothetical protein